MTEEAKMDTPRDAMWQRAQAVITARIIALRERQASENKQKGHAR